MALFDLTPEQEGAFWNQLRQADRRREAAAKKATKAVADQVSRVHRAVPHEKPGVKVAAGQAMAANPKQADKILGAVGSATAKRGMPMVRRRAQQESMTAAASPPGSVRAFENDQAEAQRWNTTTVVDLVATTGMSATSFLGLADLADPAQATQKARSDMEDELQGLGLSPAEIKKRVDEQIKKNPAELIQRAKIVQAGINGDASLTDNPVSRAVFGAMSTPLQYVQANLVGQLRNPISYLSLPLTTIGSAAAAVGIDTPFAPKDASGGSMSPQEAFSTTTAGAALAQYQQTGNVDLGEGMVPFGENNPVDQIRVANERKVLGTIAGTDQIATPGRILADVVFEPDSKAYNIMSGLTDAAVAWYGDPMNEALKASSAAREAAKVFRPASEVATDAMWAERFAGGVLRGNPKGVDLRAADNWLLSQKGRAVAQKLADDTDILSVWNATGRRADVETLVKLTDASTPEEVSQVLRRAVGTEFMDTSDLPVASWTYQARTTHKWDARIWQRKPGTMLYVNSDATPSQMRQTIDNLDLALKNAKVPHEEASQIVKQMAVALSSGGQQSKYDAVVAAENAMASVISQYTKDPALAKDVTRFSAQMKPMTAYGVDALGRDSDFGFAVTALGADDLLTDTRSIGPALLSEALVGPVYLPDARVVRRLTSKIGNAKRKLSVRGAAKAGEVGIPTAAGDFIQGEIWKPLAIIRGAYLVKVIGEEQVRMAASGLPSLFKHPLHWILAASDRANVEDLVGQSWSAVRREGWEATPTMRAADDYVSALQGKLGKHIADPDRIEQHAYKTGQWSIVNATDHPDQWKLGMADELWQLHRDPVASRLAKGETPDQVMTWLKSNDPEGQRAFRIISERGEKGEVFVDEAGARFRHVVDYNDDMVLRSHVENRVGDRLLTKAGHDEELRQVVATGQVGSEEVTAVNKELRVISAGPRVEDPFNGRASTWVGSRVKLPDGKVGVITNDADEAGHSLVRIAAPAWDEHGRPTPQLREALKRWIDDPESPSDVKYNMRHDRRQDGQLYSDAHKAVFEGMDHAVSGFFGRLYGKSSDWLSRSPAFVETYYEKAPDLIRAMSPDEANRLLKKVGENSGKLSNKTKDRIIAAARAANGDLTLEEADSYLKGYALDRVKDLLYDTSKRSNFFDTYRLIFPFGEAWKEILGAWVKLAYEQPQVIRRAQVLIEGGQELDTDFDKQGTQGFFFKDPTSGELVFNYPLTDKLTEFVTGIPAPMRGTLQGLNIGFTAIPGVGPVAQVAAAALIPDRPEYDEIREFMFPFGAGEGISLDTFTPPWAEKILDAINENGTYETTYMEVVRYLMSTGDYGSTVEERMRLENDAKQKAKILSVIRGFVQATGPTAPIPGYTVKTDKGDMLSGALINEYRKLLEAHDFDSGAAIEEFTATYGDEMVAYTTSKTRSVYGGLDASKPFGDWERENPEMFSAYPAVAGYFAPTGTDFDFQVYARQLETGKRERLSANEMADAVESTIARQKLRFAETKVPPPGERSPEDEAWLVQVREALREDYPGWVRVDKFTVGTVAARVDELIDASDDLRLNDNPVADGLDKYWIARNKAIEAARSRGYKVGPTTDQKFKGKELADVRQYLREVGVALSDEYEGFGRVWEDVLSKEIPEDE